MMKEHDVLRSDTGLTVRVLVCGEFTSFVVDCNTCKMPFQLPNEYLDTMEQLPTEAYRVLFTDDELSQHQIEQRNKRWKSICELTEDWFIVNKSERNQALKEMSVKYLVHAKTLQNYLWRYWVGQSKNALIPQIALAEQKMTVKTLNQTQKNMRWALNKFYYTTKKQTLRTAYELLLKEKYCDAHGTLQEPYPSFWQFRYFFNCNRDPANEIISREGIKKYQRNFRSFTGDVRKMAPEIGSYMTDATVADIYIVSRFSRKVIGRPIIYTMVDVHSNMVTGLYVGLEGGKNAVRLLMANAVMDKVSYCANFGIQIDNSQWPAKGMPKRILTDRGREFLGEVMENLCEDFGTEIINLPAYRPDLKGPVEKMFDQLQNDYKPFLKGKGVIEDDFQERGAHDYRKDSTLDLQQFTEIVIRCVLYRNNCVMPNYPRTADQILGEIPAIPNQLWAFSEERAECDVRFVDAERLSKALMSRAIGAITQRGLEIFGVRYQNEMLKKRFVRAGIKGREKVDVAYNPDDLTTVWLYENMEYIPVEIVQEQYRGRSLAELTQMYKQEKRINTDLQKVQLQERISLIDEIQSIAQQAQPTAPQSIGLISKNVKKHRAAEQHSEGKSVFEILADSANEVKF
ncbi:MAG: DDE-type integrase/transposase/recombinase [Oscillospiraceae bacterium]